MQSESRVSTDALTGLRGLASLHILVFHSLLFSELRVNIVGSMEMPLFFLLSGYTLGLNYGRTMYSGHTSFCCTENTQSEGEPLINSFNFYRNRFARVMPIYYLANFVLALPLLAFGNGIITLADEYFVFKLIGGIIDSIVPIGMILPNTLTPFVFAGWTISTLWFFYLFFPVILPKCQRNTNERASWWIVMLFWIQLFVAVGVALPRILFHSPLPVMMLDAYWIATGWGVSRLPVFLMGVHAGLIRLHQTNTHPYMRYRNGVISFFYAWIPWGCRRRSQEVTEPHEENDTITQSNRTWATLVNAVSISHIIVIVISAILGSLVDAVIGLYLHAIIQLISVHSLLTVVDGLTRDGGLSLLSGICNLRLTQELGRISMTLYLIHEPLMNWLCVAVKGDLNGRGAPVADRRIIPIWGIPVVLLVCPIVAWVLTKFVEEPMRKLLRAPTNT